MELLLECISKKYGNKYALKELSAGFTNGVYGILGANGAGKTTLISIITGILTQTSGKVKLDGKDIQSMGTEYLDKIGYLPQYPQFYPNFRVEEFLMYMCSIKDVSKKNAKEILPEIIEEVNLQDHIDKRVGELSGGMRQRLGIAQAILNDPEILILDEPTAGLDPGERIRFRNIISSIAKNRIVLISTHIVSDIEYIANQVVILQEGKLNRMGSVKELCSEISGHVWEVRTTEKIAKDLMKNYLTSNLKRDAESVVMRIVSKKKPIDGALPLEPQLEDVFLTVFGEQVGVKNENRII